MDTRFPEDVCRVLWDVDPAEIDVSRHRDYVIERVMTRGSWNAMRPRGLTQAMWSDVRRDFEERVKRL